MFQPLLLCPVALVLLAGCTRKKDVPGADGDNKVPTIAKGVKTVQLTSTAFKDGASIPQQYTGEGKNVSPPLKWTGAPDGTKSFALICDDPDAPGKTWTHWVLFNMPPERHELPEGVPADKGVLGSARQGVNDFKKIGYGGPMPPPGSPHRYYFKLYALDTTLDLPGGATKGQVVDALQGHSLGEGLLMGTYRR
jgi:hypothetical protein